MSAKPIDEEQAEYLVKAHAELSFLYDECGYISIDSDYIQVDDVRLIEGIDYGEIKARKRAGDSSYKPYELYISYLGVEWLSLHDAREITGYLGGIEE